MGKRTAATHLRGVNIKSFFACSKPQTLSTMRKRRVFDLIHMRFVVALALLLTFTGCDHGLEPPDAPPLGAIQGTITYLQGTSNWPPPDSLRDLRFFALPFVPQDTLDLFRDLNQLVFSDRLNYRVADQRFFVDSVQAQQYIYSGVAQQFSRNLLDWRPVGLAPVFTVRPGEITELSIVVDFENLPVFPPPPSGVQAQTNTSEPHR